MSAKNQTVDFDVIGISSAEKHTRQKIRPDRNMDKSLNCGLFQDIIIYTKKLLDSDWLRAVQFKCNTSANYTT